MLKSARWMFFCVSFVGMLSVTIFSPQVFAVYDPHDTKKVFWDGCQDIDADCDGDNDHNRNCFYKSPQGIRRSAVRVTIRIPNEDPSVDLETTNCTGLLVGERFVVTAAHCFLNHVGGKWMWPSPNDPSAPWSLRVQFGDDFTDDPGDIRYQQYGIAYFVNNDMSIGTRGRKSDEEQFKDIFYSMWDCTEGDDDIAVIVLNHPLIDSVEMPELFDLSTSCEPGTAIGSLTCSSNGICSEYGFCSYFREEVNPIFKHLDSPPYPFLSMWENQM